MVLIPITHDLLFSDIEAGTSGSTSMSRQGATPRHASSMSTTTSSSPDIMRATIAPTSPISRPPSAPSPAHHRSAASHSSSSRYRGSKSTSSRRHARSPLRHQVSEDGMWRRTAEEEEEADGLHDTMSQLSVSTVRPSTITTAASSFAPQPVFSTTTTSASYVPQPIFATTTGSSYIPQPVFATSNSHYTPRPIPRLPSFVAESPAMSVYATPDATPMPPQPSPLEPHPEYVVADVASSLALAHTPHPAPPAHGRSGTSLHRSSPAEVLRNPKRHPDFWFHDGSIILHVQNTLFKIHQTVLAAHSEVFAGLFDVPAPPPAPLDDHHDCNSNNSEDDGTLESCRIIHLPSDTASDFASLLHAVYNPSYFEDANICAGATPADDLMDFIAGILRLSTKYFMRGLRGRCVALLAGKFPRTWEEYERKREGGGAPSSAGQSAGVNGTAALKTSRSSANLRRSRTGGSNSGGSSRPGSAGEASASFKPERYKSHTIMRALHLCAQANLPVFLPYLYYCLARLSLARMLKHRVAWGEGLGDGPLQDSAMSGDDPQEDDAEDSGDAAAAAAKKASTGSGRERDDRNPYGDVDWHTKTIAMVGRERLRYAEMSMSHAFLMLWERAPTCVGDNSTATAAALPPPPPPPLPLAAQPPPLPPMFMSGASDAAAGAQNGGSAGAAASIANAAHAAAMQYFVAQQQAHQLPQSQSQSHVTQSQSHSHTTRTTPSRCALSTSPANEWRLILAQKSPNPLRQYNRYDKLDVCERCKEWAAGRHERGRREVWEALPGMFGLGEWAALEADMRAMGG